LVSLVTFLKILLLAMQIALTGLLDQQIMKQNTPIEQKDSNTRLNARLIRSIEKGLPRDA